MFKCGAPQSASQQTPSHTLSVSFSLPAHKTTLACSSVSTQSSRVRLMTLKREGHANFLCDGGTFISESLWQTLEFYPVPKVELVWNKPGLLLPCQRKLWCCLGDEKSKESRPGILSHRADFELFLLFLFFDLTPIFGHTASNSANRWCLNKWLKLFYQL